MNPGRLTRAIAAAFALALLLQTFAAPAARAQSSTISLEQQLVEKFAPIVMIKDQLVECSQHGEEFRPVVVDVLFGTDDVRLMKRGSGDKSTDTEVKRNIQASDLYNLDDSYYLDLPGQPRNPGCEYEKWGKERMKELGIEPSLYARVATEEGKDGIVVQYWYYWVFNYFNNTHESDWEGIQLNFSANTVEEILEQDLLPSSIAFAQHEGGEKGNWDDEKVGTEGTHIISHPSAGSHADYYESAIWLGWGEQGSGFGCDYSDEPNVELPVKIILIPNEVTDPNSEFAWLTYRGLWGDRQQPSMFSGPTGPIGKPRWEHPITWSEGLRSNSLPVPIHTTIGPSVSQVFCGAAEFGSRIVRVFPISPLFLSGLVITLLIGFLILTALAWRFFRKAVGLYIRHGYFFIVTGVLAFPIALLGQQLEELLHKAIVTRADPLLPESIYSRSLYQFVFHAGLGGIQEVLLACLVGPVIIYATYELIQDDNVDFRSSWKRGARLFPRVLGATLIVAILLSIMSLTVILIPLVIYKGIQWFFAPEAVVVDGAGPKEAIRVSDTKADGHLIRAASIVCAFALVSGLPGPLVGTIGLILGWFDLETAGWISAAIYCVLYPIPLIMATLFYVHISGTPVTASAPAPVSPVPAEPAPGIAPA